MSIRNILFTLLGVYLLSANSMAAQELIERSSPIKPLKTKSRVFLGPVAGLNRSLHTGGFSSRFSEASCPNFTDGTNNGYYFGLTGEYLLGDVKNSRSSIIARVIYDYQPAYFQEPGRDDYPSRLTDGSTVITKIIHTTTVTYTLAQFEIMYKLNIPGTFFGVTAGPQIGIPISSSQDQRYELVFDPNNPGIRFSVEDLATIIPKELRTEGFEPRFADETYTSIQLYNGKVIHQTAFRAAAKLGLQYEFLLNRAVFVPSVYYNIGITKMNTDDPWRVNALQIGADLRYSF